MATGAPPPGTATSVDSRLSIRSKAIRIAMA